MSAVALAVRLSVVRALTGATFAEGRVYDSAIDTLQATLDNDPKPLIVVSTEEDESTITGRDLLGGEGAITLLLEFAVAGMSTAEDGGSNVFVPTTDPDIELAIDVLRRQAMRVLSVGGGAWGDVFRKLIVDFRKVRSRRGGGAEKGMRFAARWVAIEIGTLYEPQFGAVPAGPWADFLAQVRSDPETSRLGDFLEQVLVGAPVPEWRLPADALGLSDATARAIGIAPVIEPSEAPAVLSDVTIVEQD